MINRRTFLAAAGATGLAMHGQSAMQAADTIGERTVYELRQYHIGSEEQKQGIDAYLREAAIPTGSDSAAWRSIRTRRSSAASPTFR